MSTSHAPQLQSLEYCPPVERMYGSPPDMSLMEPGAYPTEATQTASEVVAAHAYRPEELSNGEAARRAFDVGCAACALSEVCVVKPQLQEIARTAEVAAEKNEASLAVNEVMGMVVTAPEWLQIARAGDNDLMQRFRALGKNREATATALRNGDLEPMDLLSGVKNELIGVTTKEHVPELRDRAAVGSGDLAIHQLTNERGDRFEVIDASKEVHSHIKPAEKAARSILYKKLIHNMTAADAHGEPQILTPDGITQKALHGQNFEVGRFDEIRMNGKNRLYMVVTPGTEEAAHRIVILGTHGGDEATQNHFIARATAKIQQS